MAPSAGRAGYSKRKESGFKRPGFGLPPMGLSGLSPLAAVCWSEGTLQNIKLVLRTPHPAGGSPVSKRYVSGFQVSGVRKKKHRR